MKITTDGLTEHIYDTSARIDAWYGMNEEVGTYLQIMSGTSMMRIYYATTPVDVFDVQDIEMADITDTSTGRSADIEPRLFQVENVDDFVEVLEELIQQFES